MHEAQFLERIASSKIRTATDNSEDWYEFGNRVESILDEYYWRTEVSDD